MSPEFKQGFKEAASFAFHFIVTLFVINFATVMVNKIFDWNVTIFEIAAFWALSLAISAKRENSK